MSDIAIAAPCVPRPLRLARASHGGAYAELSRAIGHGRSAAVAALEARITLNQEPGAPPVADAPLLLQGPFGAIELAQGARLLRALTAIDLDGADPAAPHWEWLQAALAARLHGTPLAAVDRISREPLDTAQPAAALRLGLRSARHCIATVARAAPEVWLGFLGGADWQRARRPVPELELDIAVPLARHTLPAGLLRGLGAGDIVVPDAARFVPCGEGALALGALRLRVRYRAPDALEIIDMENKLDASEFDPDDSLDADAEAAPDAAQEDGDAGLADTIPVTLDFELGKTRLRLGDLRGLGVGSILGLQGGSPESIAILSAGRPLGRGEAVEVDGRLAIRIVQWGAG